MDKNWEIFKYCNENPFCNKEIELLSNNKIELLDIGDCGMVFGEHAKKMRDGFRLFQRLIRGAIIYPVAPGRLTLL